MSGATNLKELLLTYVPGITDIANNDEASMAMRGVYSTGQETILIMINGHRINSYSTNIASPDYSISLEKVKQIEVLRGPASSLYGGVALTAVINIIMLNGGDVDGLNVKAGMGNYGQWKGDALFGKRYFDLDVIVWGSIFNADGQKVDVKAEDGGLIKRDGKITIGGVNSTPTYDIGALVAWKGLSFMHISRFSKNEAPYSMGLSYAPYTYSKYAEYDGCKPGFAVTNHHNELTYNKELGDFMLTASLNYDKEKQNRYQVVSDSAYGNSGRITGLPTKYDDILTIDGLYRYLGWSDDNVGVHFSADYQYSLKGGHKGAVTLGGHYSHFNYIDSRMFVGGNFDKVLYEVGAINEIARGSENSSDVYMQIKHVWKQFIFNTGIRYDHKRRYDHTKIDEWSPRLSLIFNNRYVNVKFCYSRSFVDAPYLYRKYNTLSQSSPESLKSEYLDSYQVTFYVSNLSNNMFLELNGFYNKATNLIFPRGIIYSNSATIKNAGIELDAKYNAKKLHLRLNAAWIHTINSAYYFISKEKAYNVPDFSSNLIARYKFTNNFSVHSHLCFYGKQTYADVFRSNIDNIVEGKINPRIIMDLGASYTLKKLDFTLNVHNLFNKKYYQGGTLVMPMRQKGLWLLGEISYKF
jgi:iron complex outermembrane receptor protein